VSIELKVEGGRVGARKYVALVQRWNWGLKMRRGSSYSLVAFSRSRELVVHVTCAAQTQVHSLRAQNFAWMLCLRITHPSAPRKLNLYHQSLSCILLLAHLHCTSSIYSSKPRSSRPSEIVTPVVDDSLVTPAQKIANIHPAVVP